VRVKWEGVRVKGEGCEGEEGRDVRVKGERCELGDGCKKSVVCFYLLLALGGLRELGQGGGELPDQIMASINIPVIATHLHTHTHTHNLTVK